MVRQTLILLVAGVVGCSSSSVLQDGGDARTSHDQTTADDALSNDAQGDQTVTVDTNGGDSSKPTSCPNDNLGDNHTQTDAHSLTLADQDIADLVVCAGSDDWFTIDLPAGKQMQFSACVKTTDPSVEVDFFREEFPEPQYFYGGGSSSSEEKCLGTTLIEAAGRYYFRAYTTAPNSPYWVELYYADLSYIPCPSEGVACSSSETCAGGFCRCNTDPFEPNNSDSEAKDLELSQQHSLTNCVEDDDWFRVTIATAATLQIDVEVYSGVGHELDVTVYSPSNLADPLAYFPQAKNYNDSFSLPVQAGPLLLRVRNTKGGSRNYELTVTPK